MTNEKPFHSKSSMDEHNIVKWSEFFLLPLKKLIGDNEDDGEP